MIGLPIAIRLARPENGLAWLDYLEQVRGVVLVALHVPGELLVAQARRGDAHTPEDIDANKVQSERRQAVAREQRRAGHFQGRDHPGDGPSGEREA